MDRRSFLKTSAAASFAAALPFTKPLAAAGWRTFETVTRVDIAFPKGVSRAWIPLPLAADTGWHRTLGNAWRGNAGRMEVLHDARDGAAMLYVEWPGGRDLPFVEVTSRFMTRDRAVDLSAARSGAALTRDEQAFFTSPTQLIPTDGIVRRTALGVTKGAKGDLEKARAIYEWVVDNSYRDPKVRGCGWGDVKSMLESGNLGGKCGDLNALFVGLARACGIPARDVYGLRVAASRHGYRSLGVGSPHVTRAQHCRAEFFASGYGWIPVDPADVRKVVLEEPPGNLSLSHPQVVAARKRLFGSWEMNWLAYNTAHDIALPHAEKAPKLPYLMYVNAQTGGEMLDQLDPDAVKYAISAREIAA